MLKEYDIIWSPLALDSYERSIEFILKKWTNKEAVEFDEKVEDLLQKLKNYKNLCPPSKRFNQ
jgi:plasmid stabilization system protein ParE